MPEKINVIKADSYTGRTILHPPSVSPNGDSAVKLGLNCLFENGISMLFRDKWRSRSKCLEQLGIEVVPLEQFVEFGTVALGQSRRLGDVAAGDLEEFGEVFALEFASRGLER